MNSDDGISYFACVDTCSTILTWVTCGIQILGRYENVNVCLRWRQSGQGPLLPVYRSIVEYHENATNTTDANLPDWTKLGKWMNGMLLQAKRSRTFKMALDKRKCEVSSLYMKQNLNLAVWKTAGWPLHDKCNLQCRWLLHHVEENNRVRSQIARMCFRNIATRRY